MPHHDKAKVKQKNQQNSPDCLEIQLKIHDLQIETKLLNIFCYLFPQKFCAYKIKLKLCQA